MNGILQINIFEMSNKSKYVIAFILVIFTNLFLVEETQTYSIGKNTETYGKNTEPYGTRVASLSLNNIKVGGKWNYVTSYRFRASKSGTLSAIRVYWIYSLGKSGYHSGNGGTIRVSLRPDDGSPSHLPAQTIVTSTEVAMKLCMTASSNDNGPCGKGGLLNQDGIRMTFEPIRFRGGTTIEKGKLYHVVFENIDPHPAENWISLNGLYHPDGVNMLLNGQAAPNELTLLYLPDSSPWELHETTMPIMSVLLDGGEQNKASRGKEFGFGYIQPWTTGYIDSIPAVTNEVYARQKFTPSSTKRLSAVNVHIGRIEGKGSYSIELRDSNNFLLHTIEGLGANLPTLEECPWLDFLSPLGQNDSCQMWVRGTIDPPLEVQSGLTYSLIIRAEDSNKFGIALLQQGSVGYDFGRTTVFEGMSDMSYDAGATWQPWVVWETERSDADLQFYFEQSSLTD